MRSLKKIKKETGFTLVELIIVMAIIAVLVVLVIGAITMARKNSRKLDIYSDAKTISLALQKYYTDHSAYPPTANPYNSTWDAYIMTNTDPSDNTTGPQINQIQNSQTVNMKGILAHYLGSELNRKYAVTQGRLCYYGRNGVYQYLLWVQTEDELNKHPAWRTGGCPGTHGTVVREDPGSVFSLK